MVEIHKSGFFIPNIIGSQYLYFIEEILGKDRLKAILKQANLDDLITKPPQNNFYKDLDFCNLSSLCQVIEEIYGERGGRGMLLRAGKVVFNRSLKNYGIYSVVFNLDTDSTPNSMNLPLGLHIFSKIFNKISDQVTSYQECEEHFSLRIHQCPNCWGRSHADGPVCYFECGLIQESLAWISGGKEIKIFEDKCMAAGDNYCEFKILKM
jgi:predicted hydrocarbon binding protein